MKVSHVYRVYVIEARQPSGRIVLYVGQSSLSPLERMRQHVKGYRYCGPCKKRAYVPGPKGTKLRLRQDLAGVEKRMRYFTRNEAERAERKVASVLRSKGYHVLGGH